MEEIRVLSNNVEQVTNVYDINGNLVNIGVVDGGKVVKLKLDGTVKRTPNNMVKEGRTKDPIKNLDMLQEIVDFLHEKAENTYKKTDKWTHLRNQMQFVIGIYIGIRVSDLIVLKWKHLFSNCKTREFNYSMEIYENKTGKTRSIDINDDIKTAVMNYINECESEGLFTYCGLTIEPDNYIFPSRKDKSAHVTDAVVEKFMKAISDNIQHGDCKIATRTIRKTFAYNLYAATNDLALVQSILNHRTVAETRRYLGIDRETQRTAYMNLKLVNQSNL